MAGGLEKNFAPRGSVQAPIGALTRYEDAKLQGLCHDGAMEVVRSLARRHADLDPERP